MIPALRSSWLPLALLWIAGIDMRVTLLAVPPVLPLIHRDLGLTETGIAVLTGLPIALLAVAAVPGALLIARLGPRATVIIGVLLVAVASGLRGVATSMVVLFGSTFFMGVGIAVTQPAIPSLIREWLPTRIGLATAIYVNGVLVGETLSPALTLPLVLPLAAGRWEWSFGIWAFLVFLTVAPLAWLTKRLPGASGNPATAWSPEWGRAETWQLGLLLGGTAAAYFGANAFIPDFLRAIGRPQIVGACLTVLNASQLPASLVAGLAGSGGVGRRTPFLAVGAATLGSLGIFLLAQEWALLLGAGMLGFCSGVALVLCLSLPPILSDRGGVHRLSAGMFGIGYAYSFVAPLLGGAVWDLTHVPATAFLPVGVGAVTVLATAAWLRVPHAGA